MSQAEVRAVLDGMTPAIRLALDLVQQYGTGSTPGEVADCAHDQLEGTCYLTGLESWQVEAALVSEVLWVLGLDSGASDGTDVTDEQLAAAAARMDERSKA